MRAQVYAMAHEEIVALECAALRRGIEHFTEADLRRLEQNIERQRDAHAAHDVDTFYILDEAFHQALVERSGFPGVWRLAQRAKVHLNRARRLSLPAVSTIGELIEQHAAIVARVAAGDGTVAEVALSEHLRMVLADLPALQREYPDNFAGVSFEVVPGEVVALKGDNGGQVDARQVPSAPRGPTRGTLEVDGAALEPVTVDGYTTEVVVGDLAPGLPPVHRRSTEPKRYRAGVRADGRRDAAMRQGRDRQ